MQITSSHNPRFKLLLKLTVPKHQKKLGLILIEGEREILSACANKFVIQTLFSPPRVRLPATLEHIEHCILEEPLFERVSVRDHSAKLVAIAEKPAPLPLKNFHPPTDCFLLILESIEKPGNLGAMIRTAEGTGVDAIILCNPLCDAYAPQTIRNSIGTVFSLPIYTDNSTDTLSWLRQHQVRTLSTTPHTNTLYTEQNLTGAVALVIGNEAEGLSDAWLKKTIPIKIPMQGEHDSLNASVACAVVLYEALRQRSTS